MNLAHRKANEAVAKRQPLLRKLAREHGMEYSYSTYEDYWNVIHLLFTSEVKGRKVGGLVHVMPEVIAHRAFSANLRLELVQLNKQFKKLARRKVRGRAKAGAKS